MAFDREALPELTPEAEPPAGILPERIREAAHDFEDALLRRSFLWSSAITQAVFQSAVDLPSRFSHFSSGFIRWRSSWTGFPAARGFAFGGYLLAPSERQSARVVPLEVGGMTFPLVVVQGRPMLHGGPPHPQGGTGTCWAKDRSGTAAWSHGILTCRHVVIPLPTPVPLIPSAAHSSPYSATVGDIDECTIDAAILGIDPFDWPRGLSALGIAASVAPGSAIALEDNTGASQVGTVLRVFQLASYPGNLFGQRVVLDCVGMPGDSGSIVREHPVGDAVAIYMGTIPDGSVGHEGICQDMAQACAFYKIDLYR